ncbi:MAG: iron-sulfur cluster assembly scaffold protein [Woeseiaceae bacterium]|nr:iron-sulfur cluster assembly scaffold protein [Woeseiaceae bacterium]
MTAPESYNEEVRARFENPVHAGDIVGDYAQVITADVAESGYGARLVLCAGLNDGKIAALRFKVKGCPYLVAAAEAVCDSLEGGPADRLAGVSASELKDRLAVPIGRMGRMLLVEDAARELLESMGE